MPGAARKRGATCATLSIAGSTPTRPGAKCSTASCRTYAGAGRMWLNHGIVKEPPDIVAASDYTILVPAVDADGNDRAGVRAPMVAAPLGTYCGWNLRARGFGHGAMHEFSGSYLPLPETPEERRATG